MHVVVLGVDVGGTKVAVAAVDGVTVSEATEDPTVTHTTEALLDGIDAAVKRMIEEGEYCVDIMSQLRASRNAIKTIELGVLETHIDACLAEACCSRDEKLKAKRIGEIMELLKKYE